MHTGRHVLAWSFAVAFASGAGAITSACGGTRRDRATDVRGATFVDAGTRGGRWVVAYEEGFEGGPLVDGTWDAAPRQEDDPFADDGAYFRARGVVPPKVFRASRPLGRDGWLTIASAARSQGRAPGDLARIASAPDDPRNHALLVRSPEHTDATLVRTREPLPKDYRFSVRFGFPRFGDGKPGRNGYDSGHETAEPWSADRAVEQNGFYGLAILDTTPEPHNNTWIHHHRKVVVDSDNHHPAWMEIWNGSRFVESGEHPVMMFAVDGRSPGGSERAGKPFLSYAARAWQPSGEIRAADAYAPDRWYRVTITRKDDRFTLAVEGAFAFGGITRYEGTLDARANCVFHYNRPGEAAPHCTDDGTWPALDGGPPHWPANGGWPDFAMFGDPHENYYEGEVFYDDVRLEIWEP
ncbi:MAG: hypothetical protein U0169_10765 [Polyangiaceae bacterium]